MNTENTPDTPEQATEHTASTHRRTRRIVIAAAAVAALLSLGTGAAAVAVANAPRPETIAVPPTIEAKMLADRGEFEQWAVTRAAWHGDAYTQHTDAEYSDVAFRRDLAPALDGLPAWVAESLPPVSEWRENRLQLQHRALEERARADAKHEAEVQSLSAALGRPADWCDDTFYPAYPLGWYSTAGGGGTDYDDIDRWDAVEAAGGGVQARADFYRVQYAAIPSRPLGSDYVTVIAAPFPSAQVTALTVTSGLLAIGAAAGAVVAYRRRNGAAQ